MEGDFVWRLFRRLVADAVVGGEDVTAVVLLLRHYHPVSALVNASTTLAELIVEDHAV